MEEFEWLLTRGFSHIVDFTKFDRERGEKVFKKVEEMLFERMKDVTDGKKIFNFLMLPDEERKGVTNIYLAYDPHYVQDVDLMKTRIYDLLERMEIIQ